MDISAYFMPPEIRNAKKALCIQPHPDDIEIGMGGTAAALAARGCQLTYLTITNGDLGDSTGKLDFSEIAALRRKETEAAGRVVGASDFLFYGLPDGSLSDIPSLAGRIAETVRVLQPDVIFCPDPWAQYEAHNDHIVTGRAAAQAFLSSSLSRYPRDTQTAPWQAGAIAFYFTQKPNTVIDVTKTFETKCMAQRHAENLFKTLQMLVLIPYHYTFKHIWDNYYWRGEIVLRTERKQARDAHRAIKKITSEIEARIIGELPALIKSVELKDLRLKLINVLDDAGIAKNLET